jgi:hypothetical protein
MTVKNYEYLRIDMMEIINKNIEFDWLHQAPDSEWRDDYQCFFIRKGSQTHTLIALKYGDIFG